MDISAATFYSPGSCSRHSTVPAEWQSGQCDSPKQKMVYRAEASVFSQPVCSGTRGMSAVLRCEQNTNSTSLCLRGKELAGEKLFPEEGVLAIPAALWAAAHPIP